MATVIVKNKFLYIRRLIEDDIKESYYNVMGVLPRKTVEMLTMLTSAELEEELKNKRIFLIEDVNSKQMVGSASVYFLNSTSTIAKVGYIDDITTDKNYESAELREELIRYLTNYCVSRDNCIKCTCK
jgi:hypothetical protein